MRYRKRMVGEELEGRIIEEAELYCADKKITIKEVAERFGLAESTVQRDFSRKLKAINRGLYLKVARKIAYQKRVRHIRGGYATRLKYEILRLKKEDHQCHCDTSCSCKK